MRQADSEILASRIVTGNRGVTGSNPVGGASKPRPCGRGFFVFIRASLIPLYRRVRAL